MNISCIESTMGIFCLIIVLLIIGSESKSAHHIVKRSTDDCNCTQSLPCAPEYQTMHDHTICMSEGATLKKLEKYAMTDAVRKEIVDAHNAVRRKVNDPPAADMLKMSYDMDMEFLSRKWAEACKFGHDKAYIIPGRFDPGQNVGTGYSSFTKAVENWAAEDEAYKGLYGVPNNKWPKDKKQRLHYVQLIWAATSRVGCWVSMCDKTSFWVCNYAQGGNMEPMQYPYKKGARCSMCKKCDNGLCDCGDLLCNVGETNVSTCTCKCRSSFFDPPLCSINCSKGDSFFCKQSGFQDCTTEYVYHGCPHRCKYCACKGRTLETCGVASLMTSVGFVTITMLLGLAGYRLNVCPTTGGLCSSAFSPLRG